MTTPTPTHPHVEYGNREIALSNEILRSVVGSGVHGIAIAGTDDHDEMGVYIAPPDGIVGIMDPMEGRDDFTLRTQPEGARSGPGDTDLVIYSLRKYLNLAIKGNPTALLPLYAPESDLIVNTVLGDQLRLIREFFLSQAAVHRFLGYMQAQHERMMGGGRRSAVPNRPELIEKYGWDVKYGSHALRLAYQGYEIARTGHLTLPLPYMERDRVLAVKRGEVSREQTSANIIRLARLTQDLLDSGRCPLPERADREAISDWAIYAQRHHWGWT